MLTEQQIQDRNLQTAWALAAGWSREHQDRLAELVVERFIRQPERAAEAATFPRNSTYPIVWWNCTDSYGVAPGTSIEIAQLHKETSKS